MKTATTPAKKLTHGFEMNGKTYRTDAETLSVLRTVVPRAKESGDSSALCAVMMFGQATGRIVETAA